MTHIATRLPTSGNVRYSGLSTTCGEIEAKTSDQTPENPETRRAITRAKKLATTTRPPVTLRYRLIYRAWFHGLTEMSSASIHRQDDICK